jgi:hypothetical protein
MDVQRNQRSIESDIVIVWYILVGYTVAILLYYAAVIAQKANIVLSGTYYLIDNNDLPLWFNDCCAEEIRHQNNVTSWA